MYAIRSYYAYGFYLRHAGNIRLTNCSFTTTSHDERPAVFITNVEDCAVGGLDLKNPNGGKIGLSVHQSGDILVKDALVGENLETLVQTDDSESVRILNVDLPKTVLEIVQP